MRGRYLLLVIWAAAIATPAAAQEAVQIDAGRALYADRCAHCHGANGDGRGTAADFLSPRPRDFTSGSFKIRTTPSGELPTDEDLAAIIRRGMPYTAMPAWDTLSDDAIESLVAYIKTFDEDFSDPEMIIPPIEIPSPPPLTDVSRSRGRKVYIDNKCFECHGREGRGDGPSGPTLTTDDAIPIRPADLTKRWTFRGGSRREDIYRTFTTGLNGTPMPSYQDSIPDQERWELVDYVYSLSRDAPGYGDLLTATRVDVELELDPSSEVFSEAEPTLFPMVGQVTDPGRQFTPASNAITARAVYNDSTLAILLSQHAMQLSRKGSNRPDGREAAPPGAVLSDAVAIQLPSERSAGVDKPYFLYGQPGKTVDLLFYEAASDSVRIYVGAGEARLVPAIRQEDHGVRARGAFESGLWRVIFLIPRDPAAGPKLPADTFVPVAFSSWSGQAGETGNRRSMTAWYPVYLEPPASARAYGVAGAAASITLLVELGIAIAVRRSRRDAPPH